MALANACAPERQLVWLDSASDPQRFGRYSYLCFDPVERLPGGLELSALRARLAAYKPGRVHGGPPFQGGLVGYFTYDYGRWLQMDRLRSSARPRSGYSLGIYDTLIACDHQTGQCWALSAGLLGEDKQANLKRARAKLEQIGDEVAALTSHTPRPVALSWRADLSKSDYVKMIDRTQAYIKAGDIYQANVAQTFWADMPTGSSALDLYLNIRQTNPAPFGAFVQHDGFSLACTSPERLICLDQDGHAEARPIKGTIRRSSDPEEDKYLRETLEQSEKDRAENTMIVDLLRNDLSQICAPFSVKVSELCSLESYAGLHQLTSAVQGQLEAGQDGFDLFGAVFPGGSITGAPKLRAMEIIDELEMHPRRAFCGSLGYFGFDGALDFNIMIRTVQVEKGLARLDVGGGITHLSEPLGEYEETLLKAQRIRAGTCLEPAS